MEQRGCETSFGSQFLPSVPLDSGVKKKKKILLRRKNLKVILFFFPSLKCHDTQFRDKYIFFWDYLWGRIDYQLAEPLCRALNKRCLHFLSIL